MSRLLVAACALASMALAQAASPERQGAADPAPSGTEREVRVASVQDFPPFAVAKKDGTADGFTIDLFEAIANAANIKYRMHFGPWESIKDEVTAGRADVMVNMAIAPARSAAHDFTAPHTTAEAALFVRRGEDAGINSVEDLRGKSLLVVAGGNVHQWAAAQPWATRLAPVANVESAVKALAAGQHDGLLMTRVVGLYAVKAASLENIEVTPLSLPGAEQRFALAVRKGDAQLLARLNEGLAKVRADGTYDRLHDEWFDPIEPRIVPQRLLVRYAEPALALLLALAIAAALKLARSVAHLRAERANLLREFHLREAAESETRRLSEIVESTSDLVVTARVGGPLVYLNAAARRAAGLGADADLSQHLPERFFPAAQWKYIEQVARPTALRDGVWSGEIRLRMPDGREIEVSMVLLIHRDAIGKPVFLSAICRDITESKAIEEQLAALNAELEGRVASRTESLRQVTERLEFLLRGTPAVIWSCKAGGDFERTYVSPNVRDLLGYDPEEITADPAFWASRIHPEDRGRVFDGLATVGRSGTHEHEYRLRNRGGSWLWLHAEMQVIRDSSGAPMELVGYWIDVTERKRAEDAIVEALRLKSEFMQNVTHELRTPLNSVIGFAGLLKDEVPGPLNPKQAQFAADILSSGERLLMLVEGILEMTRLDAGGAVAARETVDISAALQDRLAAHRMAVQTRRLTMRLDLAPRIGSAQLDPLALRRILDALLDNAIKFNREGGTVIVRARHDGGGLEIAVTDTGIGIAPADREKMFKPLVQLDAGLARNQPGVGLGLALARRLAELEGGTIEVESEPGKGSTFTLHLPMRMVNP
jgi:PAS domain S-box-containing protein